MKASRFIRKLRVCAPVAVLGLLLCSAAAYGQATPGKFSIVQPINGVEPDFVCQPAAIGVITGTETVVGEFITTPNGIHLSGTATQDYRIDFADGRYLVSSSPDHFNFNMGSGNSPSVSNEVQQDRGTLYAVDGQVIGIVSVSSHLHTTWLDSNGNNVPDPGEITASVDTFRVSCPG